MAKFALLIGVSEYGEGFDPLSAPPNDVAAMQRVLTNPELGGFDPANVKTLLNPSPVEMQRGILNLFSGSTKDDLILLFFSGHGITNDDNHLYFCTCQTSKADYLATAVPASFIQNLSNNLNYAKRQVMILDCCYSGAFAEGWQRKGDIKLELERELGKEGRVVLTSSSATQVSWQQEDAALSLYTQYLVEGLEEGGADEDGDGLVKVRELHSYAKRQVKKVKPKVKPDIIVGDDEGYEIVVSRVKVDAASAFRQQVESKVDPDKGKIRSRRAEELLQKRATNLGLSPEKTQEIIDSVLAPFQRKLKSLERYRQEYWDEVSQEYPLSAATLDDLQEWQQEVLGLEDRDVTSIQAEINQQMEAQMPPPDPEPSIDITTVSTPVATDKATPPKPQSVQVQTFSFETAKITGTEKTGGILGLGGQVNCTIKRQTLKTECFVENLGKGVTLELMPIPAGECWMGQTDAEKQELLKQVSEENYQKFYATELPRHKVKISAFCMGKFTVTQAQYEAVMGNNPATKYDGDRFVAPNKPVVGVSWHDAVAFCQKLSDKTGNQYRLPSEAEWEYACRAGTETPFYFGETITTELANYDGNYTYGPGPKGEYRKKTMPVGNFSANKFGLFDMHGNVWEWCQDPWHENYQGAPADGKAWEANGNEGLRLLRGGSWDDIPSYCRSADRGRDVAGIEDNDIGFRVVCSSPRTL